MPFGRLSPSKKRWDSNRSLMENSAALPIGRALSNGLTAWKLKMLLSRFVTNAAMNRYSPHLMSAALCDGNKPSQSMNLTLFVHQRVKHPRPPCPHHHPCTSGEWIKALIKLCIPMLKAISLILPLSTDRKLQHSQPRGQPTSSWTTSRLPCCVTLKFVRRWRQKILIPTNCFRITSPCATTAFAIVRQVSLSPCTFAEVTIKHTSCPREDTKRLLTYSLTG